MASVECERRARCTLLITCHRSVRASFWAGKRADWHANRSRNAESTGRNYGGEGEDAAGKRSSDACFHDQHSRRPSCEHPDCSGVSPTIASTIAARGSTGVRSTGAVPTGRASGLPGLQGLQEPVRQTAACGRERCSRRRAGSMRLATSRPCARWRRARRTASPRRRSLLPAGRRAAGRSPTTRFPLPRRHRSRR